MSTEFHLPSLPALVSEKPVVPVVSSFDASFAPVYSVLLASLLSHAKPEACYDLILLTEKVPPETIYTLQAQARHFPYVQLRHVDMTHYPIPFLDKVIFPKPAFFRLAMPELLPDYDRAIYLDTDTILLHDVAELLHSPPCGFAAAAPDITLQSWNNTPQLTMKLMGEEQNMPTYWQKYLGLSPRAQKTYFNSGVMVLNMREMRQAQLSTAMMALVRTKPFVWVDQDILNIVFDGNIQPLSSQWNFFPELDRRLLYPDAFIDERESVIKNKDIHLIHYSGKKPWRIVETFPYAEYFWLYAKQSSYYKTLCAQRRAVYRAQPLSYKITTSPPLMWFKKKFPGVYGKLKTCWKRSHD